MDNKTIELAALMAEISALETEVEGMKAVNKECEMNGDALAYPESVFIDTAAEMQEIAAKMRALKD